MITMTEEEYKNSGYRNGYLAALEKIKDLLVTRTRDEIIMWINAVKVGIR